jgi:hypothetical protein
MPEAQLYLQPGESYNSFASYNQAMRKATWRFSVEHPN